MAIADHRRVIKDNLRLLLTSLIGRRYLVLPHKPAADQIIVKITKDCQSPSEDHQQPLVAMDSFSCQCLWTNFFTIFFHCEAISGLLKISCGDGRLDLKASLMIAVNDEYDTSDLGAS